MKKEHNVILGQEFVKKQNDKINEVVHISILKWDREC
jgi:hypothetical protein